MLREFNKKKVLNRKVSIPANTPQIDTHICFCNIAKLQKIKYFQK